MSLLDALADLVLPRSCVGCGRDGTAWCLPCRPFAPPAAVPVRGPVRVTAAAAYGDATRAALLAYKERARADLRRPLAELLAGAVGGSPPAPVLVPVPSSRAARRERGGDPVGSLARAAARRHGLRVAPALRIRRAVADSAGLGAAARAVNMRGAMSASRPRGDGVALLVDDIVTTGATLTEATRALEAAGWSVIGAAVVAATPRRAGDAADPWSGSARSV